MCTCVLPCHVYLCKSEEVIKNPATGDSGELPGEELGIKPKTSGKAAVLLTTESQCKHFKLAYKLQEIKLSPLNG